jgi:general secretion pathway protein L
VQGPLVTLQELLNSDVEAIGAQLRQGWDWWTWELANLAPERWRRRARSGRPQVSLSENGQLRLQRRGRPDEAIDTTRARRLIADVAIPAGLALRRRVILPAVGAADLRRLLALELDRLTPFRAEEVYFDFERLEPAAGRQPVELAVIRRADAEAALKRVAARGVTPLRLGVAAEDGVRFDFLPGLRAAGLAGGGRASAAWWGVAAGLFALNVAIMVWKDVDDLAQVRQAVELQRPAVTLALKLRQKVEQEDSARRSLLARRAHNDPLRIEDAVARAFPPPQLIQRLEWNGKSLRLVGQRDPKFDVLAAIRASDLGAARSLVNTDPVAAGAKAQFDVVAEPGAEARR